MNKRSLHIVGAGDLAHRVVHILLDMRLIEGLDSSSIRYETRHIKPESAPPSDFLLIAFPPGEDYAHDVAKSFKSWNKAGQAVLVSSIGVHSEADGAWITEKSPFMPHSNIVEAEKVAEAAGAHIVRLAGLYDEARGPHIFWQKNPESTSWAGGLINLIHRDDAADVCARLLASKLYPSTWLVSDGHPLTRVEIATAWAMSKKLPATRFTGVSGSLGKQVSASKLREALNWQPRWKNFFEFCKSLSA